MKKVLIILLIATSISSCGKSPERETVSLNGVWQIAKTQGQVPEDYTSVATVPGLVDMAQPPLDTVFVPEIDAENSSERPSYGYKEGWYWHRRSFQIQRTGYDIMQLKIFKARYHTKVYINGKFVGENPYCFTPSYFDLKPFLKRGHNEIVIGIGCSEQLMDTIPWGHDFEKLKYIPGIYDNVEITLSNKPFITNIQCVPNIKESKLRVVAEIDAPKQKGLELFYTVTEKATGRKIVIGTTVLTDFEIDLPGATLWTPDNPFLYELSLSTIADTKKTVFGMRSFRFDPEKRIALLNEEPFYLRGTNVCIFRFFEDAERKALPWNLDWTVKLHQRFKDMNWDMARYCIGFPPEHWYEVCDSLGIMIQDEYPLWEERRDFKYGVRQLSEEYRRWMRERWNHPCVVIWDAQNETINKRTAEAFRQVRDLDLSNRPWENGWSEPDRHTDPVEAHPYRFIIFRPEGVKEPEEGYRKNFFSKVSRADNDASSYSETVRNTGKPFPNPSLINEYGWIWLNRDGSTTTLTDYVYETLWQGSKLSAEQRFHIYARNLAMTTEYWRAHRQAAGVLHFCGLAYSRPKAPRGQTSDHFIDLENLVYEPEFYKYVKMAFSPVGVMVDFWEKSSKPKSTVQIPVYIINDLPANYEQNLSLTLESEGKTIWSMQKQVAVNGYESKPFSFDVRMPEKEGDYLLRAEIIYKGESVCSLRDIKIIK